MGDDGKIEMHDEGEDTEAQGDPPAWDQATAHISPQSALAALAAHPLDASAP